MQLYLIHTEQSWPIKILADGDSPEEAVEKYLPERKWLHKIVSKAGIDRMFISNEGWVQVHLLNP
jgi:hypothetical protein